MTPNEQTEAWARLGLRYAFNEYRACWKLAGQPLVQRLSDKNHSWGNDGLASLIPNGLAQGLIGYAFNCPDMVGGGQYEDLIRPDFKVDAELFVRYAQCSALFPMMQFSTAPWRVLDEAHLNLCIEAATLHCRMGDEIAALARHAAETGEPIMRHMAYVFPKGDFEQITDQFMLGDDILVAPVLQKGATTRTIAFPSGTWYGDDGSHVTGPCVIEVDAPLSRLPWYRREQRVSN
ncbi:glycoside hydrolase family 31 protein [Paenibacillus sp. AR247]|uniref:glycoside hydrolase family 31 protein n=1 Tax=Paenibacillus sp. AR247 TaxID=1631599 RepID=UPI0021589DC5|nr:glycoside hydrolase family 31 protein [Paenibacillus sp. AR247]